MTHSLRPHAAPISPVPPSAPCLHDTAIQVAEAAADRAGSLDHDGAFPASDIGALERSGLLLAPFPPGMGGHDLGSGPPLELLAVLSALGRGSLSLGRLFEGHVNAVKLVRRYGGAESLKLLHGEALAGFITGVWMAERDVPLRLERAGSGLRLSGCKVLASGAGHVRRPLVAALDADGASRMVIPRIDKAWRADTSTWTPLGMLATATGTVDFSGLAVDADEIIGAPGDYMRSPYFRGGAWRVLAVQLGGLESIVELYRRELSQSRHASHPIQLARFGEITIGLETARLWVRQACLIAEDPALCSEDIDAYVDLARNAFEGVAVRAITLVQKAIGLNAFMRPNPLERVIRDLTTYLRQPALDISLLSAASRYLQRPVPTLPGGRP